MPSAGEQTTLSRSGAGGAGVRQCAFIDVALLAALTVAAMSSLHTAGQMQVWQGVVVQTKVQLLSESMPAAPSCAANLLEGGIFVDF